MVVNPGAVALLLIESAAAFGSVAVGLYIWAKKNGYSLARAMAIFFLTLGLVLVLDVSTLVFKKPSAKFVFYFNRLAIIIALGNLGRVFIGPLGAKESSHEEP